MRYAEECDGDLYNAPRLHSCMGDCGAYVTPDPDGAIPALCDGCRAAAPPLKLYNRAAGPAHSNFAPPIAPETAWERLMRLADQAVDGNGVRVRSLADDWRTLEVTSQRGVTTYCVTIADSGITCTDRRTGWPCRGAATGRGCAHIGAAYRYLTAQRAAVAPVVYGAAAPVAFPAPVRAKAGKVA